LIVTDTVLTCTHALLVPVDIKLLNVLCDLLQQLEPSDRIIMFRGIAKLLSINSLYKALAKEFALDLLLDEILAKSTKKYAIFFFVVQQALNTPITQN